MKIIIEAVLNLRAKEAGPKLNEAIRLGLRDTIVRIHEDAFRMSPYLTGNNRRSIASEVSGMGVVIQGEDSSPEKVVDDTKNEAACYSTSGYGGYLETGTFRMAARPYFRPALDMHFDELVPAIRSHLEDE